MRLWLRAENDSKPVANHHDLGLAALDVTRAGLLCVERVYVLKDVHKV